MLVVLFVVLQDRRKGQWKEEGSWPVLSNKSGMYVEGLSTVTSLP